MLQRRDSWIWLGLVVGVGLALWLTAPAWGARPPGGDDVMGHLVRADWSIHHIFGHLRLDGWFPRFMAGHQEFLLYGPGFDWSLGATRVLTLGLLSDAGAMKVVAIGSIVLLGPAVAYLARSFGLSRRGAVLAAILSYAVDSPYGLGMSGTFVSGLVPHQAAAPVLCVALGACWRVLDGRDARVAAVAAGAALIVLHPISVLVLTVLLGLCLAIRALTARLVAQSVVRLSIAGLVVFGLTAFWLVPYLVHRDLRGPLAEYPTPSLSHRLGDIFARRILFGPGIAALVIVGFVVVVVLAAGGATQPTIVVVLPTTYVVLAHLYRVSTTNETSLVLTNRGLGYAGVIAIMGLAHAIDLGMSAAWRFVDGRRPTVTVRAVVTADVLAVLIAVAVVVVPSHGKRVARQSPVATQAMSLAATQLQRLLPPTGRFAVQRDLRTERATTGVSEPELWLAFHAGRDELNVFNGESTASALVGYGLDDFNTAPPVTVADRLGRLGVSDIVTVDASTPARLAASGRFTTTWRDGDIAILTVRAPSGTPVEDTLLSAAPPADLQATLVSSSSEHPRWSVAVRQPARITVAIAWSPKWHARIDGHAVSVDRSADGESLVMLDVPAGQSTVALDYRPDVWDHAGQVLTVLTVVALLAWRVERRRLERSQRPASRAPGADDGPTAARPPAEQPA
jgi:hypothetical protein